jgi:HTH-type transcriptional regulator/antitoxin HigA
MAQIKTEKQYEAACNRINELLKIVGNDTPADDKNSKLNIDPAIVLGV